MVTRQNAAFGKSCRLLHPREFRRVFERSRSVSDGLFIVRVRFSRQAHARLGLAISKRHARRAVDRNRIKRHAREVFRSLFGSLTAGDYVVLNRPGAATAAGGELRVSLTRLLQQVGEKKPPPRAPDSA